SAARAQDPQPAGAAARARGARAGRARGRQGAARDHLRGNEKRARGAGARARAFRRAHHRQPGRRRVRDGRHPGSAGPLPEEGPGRGLCGEPQGRHGARPGIAGRRGPGARAHRSRRGEDGGPRRRDLRRHPAARGAGGERAPAQRRARHVRRRHRAARPAPPRHADRARPLVRIRARAARGAQPRAGRARLRALRARLGADRLARVPLGAPDLHEALRGLMRYPERDPLREGALDSLLVAAQYLTGRVQTGRRRLWRIVEHTKPVFPLEEVRRRLRREGFTEVLAGAAFALIREAAQNTTGMRHHDVQLVGGWAILQGMLAEMETGEGKTLTCTLPAATAALAGRAVHVITVNDYLAGRDADTMRPVYQALGLTVGCVKQGMQPDERRAAYACDIVYCSNKEITFDYLRDRMALGGRPRPIAQRVGALAGDDRADSVLIDEARTPLILSAPVEAAKEEEVYRHALRIARLMGDADYFIEDQQVMLTDAGSERVRALAAPLGGVWSGPRRSERFVCQALTALELFERDKHYLVRDGKVQII